MDIEKDSNREAFEAWFESRYDAHFMQFALDLDVYADKHTQTCWEAWQAVKAQAIPDGFVVVPKELTEATKQKMMRVFRESDKFLNCNNMYSAMIEAQEQSE